MSSFRVPKQERQREECGPLLAISTHNISSTVTGSQDGDSSVQERWARMVLRGIWLLLIAAVCIMFGLAFFGSLSMFIFFIALGCASFLMLISLIVADRSSRFPNPVAMPWIRMLRSLLAQVVKRN